MVGNTQQETYRLYHGNGDRYKSISPKVETLRVEKNDGQTKICCADERATEEVRNALRDAGIPLRDDLPNQRKEENIVFIDNDPTRRAMDSLGKYAAKTYEQTFQGQINIGGQAFDIGKSAGEIDKSGSTTGVKSGISGITPQKYANEIHSKGSDRAEFAPGAITAQVMTNFPPNFPQREEIEQAIKADLQDRFKEFKAEEQAIQQNGGIPTLAAAALAEKGLITGEDKTAIIATEKEVLQQKNVEPEKADIQEFETNPGRPNLIDVDLDGSNGITSIQETGHTVQVIAHPKTAKLMSEMSGEPVRQFSDTNETYVELEGGLRDVAPQLAKYGLISGTLNQKIQEKAQEMGRTPPGAKEAQKVGLQDLGVKPEAVEPESGNVNPGEIPGKSKKGTGTRGM